MTSFVVALFAASTLFAMTASQSVARERFPVMGCANLRTQLSFYDYKPFGTCWLLWNGTGGFYESNLARIFDNEWQGWGSSRATGRGYFSREVARGWFTGDRAKATMTLFGLLRASNPDICALGGESYSKLRVTWNRWYGNRKWNPGGSHIFSVMPIDVGC